MKLRIFKALVPFALITGAACVLLAAAVFRAPPAASLGRVAGVLIPAVCAAAVLSLLSGYAAAALIAEKTVGALNGLDFEDPRTADRLKELEPLISRIRRRDDLISRQTAELEKKQAEFRMITENMREGFLIADADGRLVTYNSSALKLLGADRASGGSRISGNIADLCGNQQYRAAVSSALAGVNTSQVVGIDGRFCHIFASPSVEGGRVTGLAMIILDVTEREQWEELRREFTSNVSHELKTPLTTIRGTAEIMLGGIVRPEDTERFLKSIYDEAGRLLNLIEDILKLSQLDENKISGEFEEVDLYALAKKTTDGLTNAAQLNDISLELRGGPAGVAGVPVVLEEMIFNLVDNAIKYNRPGGRVAVEVSEEGGRAVLRVSDTGIGIPEAYKERVFERFFRVDKSRSKAAGGTGLGLSIVKHAAAYHGAELRLESRENEGTTVTVAF